MPLRDWRVRVQDILEAVGSIRSYTSGMTFEQFADDRKTIDAVIRNLEVMGDASRRLPAHIKNDHPRIPWSEMGSLRIILGSEYLGVDLTILWTTVQHELAPLEEPLRAVLAVPELTT